MLVFHFSTLCQGGPSSLYDKEEEGSKNGWREEKEEKENDNNNTTEKNKNNGSLSPGLETLQQTLYNHGTLYLGTVA